MSFRLCELATGWRRLVSLNVLPKPFDPFWQGLPHRPDTDGLADEAKAELLLRTGTLTGWLGSAKQVPGAQEIAKDLISESAAIFEDSVE